MLNNSLSVSSTISRGRFRRRLSSPPTWWVRIAAPFLITSFVVDVVCANRFKINNVTNFSPLRKTFFYCFLVDFWLPIETQWFERMLCQVFLVLLAAVGSCRASFQYNEFTDYFIKLNEEVLSVNHQNAQLAWDTKWEKWKFERANRRPFLRKIKWRVSKMEFIIFLSSQGCRRIPHKSNPSLAKIHTFVPSIKRHQALISILSPCFQLWPPESEKSWRGSRFCGQEAKVAVDEMLRDEKLFTKVTHSAEKNLRSAVSWTEVLSRTTEVTTQLSRR